jgi:hypothetical protein
LEGEVVGDPNAEVHELSKLKKENRFVDFFIDLNTFIYNRGYYYDDEL